MPDDFYSDLRSKAVVALIYPAGGFSLDLMQEAHDLVRLDPSFSGDIVHSVPLATSFFITPYKSSCSANGRRSWGLVLRDTL